MMNAFLLRLSDEQLSLTNAEDLEVQDEAAIEHFFALKLRKGLISSEMISAAIDKELPEPLAKSILMRAEKNPETANLARDFKLLAHQVSVEYRADLKAGKPAKESRSDPSAIPYFSKKGLEQDLGVAALKVSQDISSEEETDAPPPPLRWDLMHKLNELDGFGRDNEASRDLFRSFINSLKDLASIRVGAPAFASLIVGIFSTSTFFQYAGYAPTSITDPQFIASGPSVTRGVSLSEEAGSSQALLTENIVGNRPFLLQSGNEIQTGGLVSEADQWTISARSLLDGTARLYSSDSDGILTLLDTQPAYRDVFFTFNNFRVSDQITLDLRVIIVSEDNSTELAYNLTYNVE